MRGQTFKARVSGMTCTSCEKIISRELSKLQGVNSVHADYASGSLEVIHDGRIGEKDIEKALNKNGYALASSASAVAGSNGIDFGGFRLPSYAVAFGALLVILGAYFILSGVHAFDLPSVDSEAGLLTLFALGLLSSFHCVGMCGGFVVSYSAACASRGQKGILPHLLYAGGRLVSYTIIGGLFGLLGAFIAITLEMRAAAAILAGLFLLLFGLNTLNVYPPLRRLMPRLPNLARGIVKTDSSPLLVGLANGLFIACGPLQAMYVLAAGTGSMVGGAMALAAFALGTLPLMFSFGVLAGRMSFSMHALVNKFSGAVVLLLALLMLNNGLTLAGNGISLPALGAYASTGLVASEAGQQQVTAVQTQGAQEAYMEVDGYGYSPDALVVKKGVPVKWIVNVTKLTGCNQELVMREYGIDVMLKRGVQTIEFTPTRTGEVSFTCGMGMLRGKIVVVEDNSAIETNKTQTQTIKQTTNPLGTGSASGGCHADTNANGCGGCGGSGACGGGCGCGG